MKKLIKNGFVIDGTGAPGLKADVLIHDGKIEKIAASIDATDAEIIDAEGLAVAPGFIDTHSHSDLQILLNPEVMPKIMQGITTEVVQVVIRDMKNKHMQFLKQCIYVQKERKQNSFLSFYNVISNFTLLVALL